MFRIGVGRALFCVSPKPNWNTPRTPYIMINIYYHCMPITAINVFALILSINVGIFSFEILSNPNCQIVKSLNRLHNRLTLLILSKEQFVT